MFVDIYFCLDHGEVVGVPLAADHCYEQGYGFGYRSQSSRYDGRRKPAPTQAKTTKNMTYFQVRDSGQ
jgi:hypothetical protein